MSKIGNTALLLLPLVAWPATVYADELWYLEQELVVEACQERPEARGQQKVWWDGRRIRAESTFAGHTTVALIDEKLGQVKLLFPEQQAYAEVSLADYQRALAARLGSSGLDQAGTPITVTPTEQQRNIGAWSCRLVRLEVGGRWPVRAELWLAEQAELDVKAYLELLGRLGLGKIFGRLGRNIIELGRLVVEARVEQQLHGQKLVTRQRLLRLRREPERSQLFAVPEKFLRLEDSPSASEQGGE